MLLQGQPPQSPSSSSRLLVTQTGTPGELLPGPGGPTASSAPGQEADLLPWPWLLTPEVELSWESNADSAPKEPGQGVVPGILLWLPCVPSWNVQADVHVTQLGVTTVNHLRK